MWFLWRISWLVSLNCRSCRSVSGRPAPQTYRSAGAGRKQRRLPMMGAVRLIRRNDQLRLTTSDSFHRPRGVRRAVRRYRCAASRMGRTPIPLAILGRVSRNRVRIVRLQAQRTPIRSDVLHRGPNPLPRCRRDRRIGSPTRARCAGPCTSVIAPNTSISLHALCNRVGHLHRDDSHRRRTRRNHRSDLRVDLNPVAAATAAKQQYGTPYCP